MNCDLFEKQNFSHDPTRHRPRSSPLPPYHCTSHRPFALSLLQAPVPPSLPARVFHAGPKHNESKLRCQCRGLSNATKLIITLTPHRTCTAGAREMARQ